MLDVAELFRETENAFTVHVVEQSFVIGRGNEYFKSFRGKENYIFSDRQIRKRTERILAWICKHTPNIAELIQACLACSSPASIIDVVSSLSKLFSVSEHQAAGPEVIDPVIIQEGDILKKNLAQFISLHKTSILRPAIIILLRDNDFERAKKLLSHCPNGMVVKMIRNSGEIITYKVINDGAKDVDEFLDAYSRHCFSTCTNTEKGVLLNAEWAENRIVGSLSPAVFQIRSTLINEQKDIALPRVQSLLAEAECIQADNASDQKLRDSFLCIAKLLRVYCYDIGGQDINDAWDLAKELNDEVLLAHVYRFSHFFAGCSRTEKQDFLGKAEAIFARNNIADHAVYCLNNNLIHQFAQERIDLVRFHSLQERALADTPGLVGMSHILNNVGVAFLFRGQADRAIEYFDKGIERARDRIVQKLSLLTNRLAARAYSFDLVEEKELRLALRMIFDGMGMQYLPYIASHFVVNTLAISLIQKQVQPGLYHALLHEFKVIDLVQNAFDTNMMGTGSIIKQMETLSVRYPEFQLLDQLRLPRERTPITGIRLDYIVRYGLNPFFFNAWM